MVPGPNQLCESCGKESSTLLDARVRLTDKWPKGHWVFLCPECQAKYGVGLDNESIIIYQKCFGRIFEIRGRYKMSPEVIQSFIAGARNQAAPDEEWKITLIGEIAYHLSLQSELLKAHTDHLGVIVDEMRKSVLKAKEQFEWCKCGHAKENHKESDNFTCSFEDCLCLKFRKEENDGPKDNSSL